MNSLRKVELSTISILKVLGILVGAYFLWLVKEIIALLFVVLIIVATIEPIVSAMEKSSIPRVVGVSLVFLGVFLVLAAAFSVIIPPLIVQVIALGEQFPTLIASAAPFFETVSHDDIQEILKAISSQLSQFTSSFFTATASIFGGAFAAITVIVISFYMLVDAKKNKDSLLLLVPNQYNKVVTRIVQRVGIKLGAWLRGQILLSFIIGVVSYIGLLILGVPFGGMPFALTLAVLAGLLEIIPFVGPIIAGLSAVIVAFTAGSWQLALAVFVFYVVIQQLESHLLIPKMMSDAVGLSPVIVIIALAIGAQLAGIPGAALAVPIAAVLAVLIQDVPYIRKAISR